MNQLAMFEQPKPFHWRKKPDICARKHGGNPQSTLANQRGDHPTDRQRVYELIQVAGPTGRTLDEVAAILGVAPNRISGRVTQLKVAGKIKSLGTTRLTRTGSQAAIYLIT